MQKILLFIFILLLPSSLQARETLWGKYLNIAEVWKQSLFSKDYTERKQLIQNIQNKYSFIPKVWWLIPTYDTTTQYTPYIQKYKLSCEIAAVKMIMNSWDINVSEEDVFYRIPIFSWVYQSWGIWGDPEKEFVGDFNGSQYSKTGYGIYEKPLANYFEKRGFQSTIINSSSYQSWMSVHRHLVLLLKNLHKWSRIILWGDYCTNTSSEDGILRDNNYRTLIKLFPIAAKNECDRTSSERQFSWKTQDGKMIKWLSWEHVFLLLWYIGNIDKPSHIIVWDTSTGRHIFPYDEWMRKWSLLDFRSLIVTKK